MASGKALDKVFKVEPTSTAKKIRELVYSAFMVEDHTLHFYFLGGPDFIVGPQAPAGERNILGVIGKVGLDAAKSVIGIRKRLRNIITKQAGKVIHPMLNLPGGVAIGVKKEDRDEYIQIAKDSIEFAKFTLGAFENIVLKNKDYVDVIVGDVYKHKTYYMGMVDKNNKVNFYDGELRVVDPEGKEFAKFKTDDYLKHIEEHVEPWSYIKFPYLKNVGWKGFVDGKDSGVYRVAPLARLNAADGMATPLAQAEYEKMYKTLGGKPAHNTLAIHWARLIELLYAAERLLELAKDDEILSPNFRVIPTEVPDEGIGVVEAPRGTLFHHYKTNEKGLITKANLIVATLGNSAAICMSIEKAAKGLIKGGNVSDGLLNMVEMAFRAYDPCFGCATHSLPGQMPLEINIRDCDGKIRKTLRQ